MTDSEKHQSPWPVRATNAATGALGSTPAIFCAVGVILVWALSGPLFGFSDTWQLIINTFTTLVTFVMVFVIQAAQNRDGRAIQVKLDDLLYSVRSGNNALVGIEDLPEKDIKALQEHVRELAKSHQARRSPNRNHS